MRRICEQRMCDWIKYVEPLQWWDKWLVLWNIHCLAHSQWVLRHFASNILSDRHQLVNSLYCCRWQMDVRMHTKSQSGWMMPSIESICSQHWSKAFLSHIPQQPHTIYDCYSLRAIANWWLHCQRTHCRRYVCCTVHTHARSLNLSMSFNALGTWKTSLASHLIPACRFTFSSLFLYPHCKIPRKIDE